MHGQCPLAGRRVQPQTHVFPELGVDSAIALRFEAVYQALVRRALAGERVAFPADLTAPTLTHHAQPLTEEARADAPQRALELSPIADSAVRPARLVTAPASWQPTIRHSLA